MSSSIIRTSLNINPNLNEIVNIENQTFYGIKTFNDNLIINRSLPNLTGTQDVNAWLKFLTQLHITNTNSLLRVVAYTQNSGVAPVASAYASGVYSPIQNRMYLVPSAQAPQTQWHYIDCSTGNVVAYTQNSGVTPVIYGYQGSVYSPTQNRIYLIPSAQANQTQWHYIDCSTGNVVAYTQNSGVTPVANGYIGGVYSPTQNRIYLVPNGQSNQTQWHYIDCSTGNVVAYTQNSGVTPVNGAYYGGVYSPTQNRVYFVPRIQSDQTKWHYIDCSTGNVVAYTQNSGVTPLVDGYTGGVYSPTQNRIYFVPFNQSNQAQWHYIDCSTGNVVAYTQNSGVTPTINGYISGVYSPTQNRIYFVPNGQATQTNWHYIDCSTGNVVAYTQNSGATPVNGAYGGGIFSPTQNRIYLAPYGQSNQTNWHYIDCISASTNISPHMFGSTILSSTY